VTSRRSFAIHVQQLVRQSRPSVSSGSVERPDKAAAIEAASCLALEAPAGAITINHVRLLQGSAPSTSDASRRPFLVEDFAGDAGPLVGSDWPKLHRTSTEGRHFTRPTDGICASAHPIARQRAVGSIYQVQASEPQPASCSRPGRYLQSKRTPPMPGSCAARRVYISGASTGGTTSVTRPDVRSRPLRTRSNRAK
jgi:hypothetical protein